MVLKAAVLKTLGEIEWNNVQPLSATLKGKRSSFEHQFIFFMWTWAFDSIKSIKCKCSVLYEDLLYLFVIVRHYWSNSKKSANFLFTLYTYLRILRFLGYTSIIIEKKRYICSDYDPRSPRSLGKAGNIFHLGVAQFFLWCWV